MERRLTAILAADVVGYSRLMSEDQSRTLDALRAFRSTLFEPQVQDHRGTVVKSMGDGWIVEFPSISDAAACGVAIQHGLAGHEVIQLRVGIHIGDVVFDDQDVFGEGVNIAARLEGLAEPGQVLISDSAYQSLDGKAAGQFGGGQAHQLKNIPRAVAVWRWPSDSDATSNEVKGEAAPAPDKPSIAVLPFDNMSSDKEQEYFADGITEDIITELSKFRWLMVIARNSSFSFKGQSFDIRDVGQALGVRYVLEGSIRRAGERVRITGQLIDAADGSHIWADKFDGVLSDIFELQDKITLDVISAIEPTLRQAEVNRLRVKPTEDLQAYELYLRAQSHFHLVADEENLEAIRLLSIAVEADPGYAIAAGLLAWCFVQRSVQNWELEKSNVPRAIALAEQVLKSDRADAMALAYAAHVIMMFTGDNLRAKGAFDRSLADNPNSALAHTLCSFNYNSMMAFESAILHAEKALQLSPRDTFRYSFHMSKAMSLLFLQRFDEAIESATAAIIDRKNFLISHYILIAALELKGELVEARAAVGELKALSPEVTMRSIRESVRFFQNEASEPVLQALSQAGIPE
ncbi:MAG: adenylate/guanylate cyclase domain-containing protein [Rhodospirillaceae bacterium]|nr:adenylate/guanylate cyclase domain-containing protein [Rhodospirillaceae bacterium]